MNCRELAPRIGEGLERLAAFAHGFCQLASIVSRQTGGELVHHPWSLDILRPDAVGSSEERTGTQRQRRFVPKPKVGVPRQPWAG